MEPFSTKWLHVGHYSTLRDINLRWGSCRGARRCKDVTCKLGSFVWVFGGGLSFTGPICAICHERPGCHIRWRPLCDGITDRAACKCTTTVTAHHSSLFKCSLNGSLQRCQRSSCFLFTDFKLTFALMWTFMSLVHNVVWWLKCFNIYDLLRKSALCIYLFLYLLFVSY